MTFPRLVFAVETIAVREAESPAASAELRPASERAAATVRLTMLTFMSTPLDLLFAYWNTEERGRRDFRIPVLYDLLKLVGGGRLRLRQRRCPADMPLFVEIWSAGPSFCRLGPSLRVGEMGLPRRRCSHDDS